MRIPGFTSTGSKRPEALFGAGAPLGLPVRLSRASGAEVWDAQGRKYLDFIMALGAVSLGYGHPEVNQAAHGAIDAGVVGPLPPESEERLAEQLATIMPWMERTRFLKTGAEAVVAAVRLARAATGRELILRCGYHGWLDWSQPPGTPGVPTATFGLTDELPFNDVDRARALIRLIGNRLAAVVIEPVVEAEPHPEWLATLREETRRVGALLVIDEIKTGFRLALGGATERYRLEPDLVVLGKALANGFPLAAVGGRRQVMEEARRTWISSTLATEMVALAAAEAAVTVAVREHSPERLRLSGGRLYDGLRRLAERHPAVAVRDHSPERLRLSGGRLYDGLRRLAERHPAVATGVGGVPEMCFLRFTGETTGALVSRVAAENGLLWKRSAYNFVSLAHDDAAVDRALELLHQACAEVARANG